MALALFKAAEKGKIEEVRSLLEGSSDVDQVDEGMLNYTALHYATWRGHTELVSLLLSRGAKCNLRGQNGWTPLYLAVHEGHTEIIKRLLETSADTNVVEELGDSILHKAVYQGSETNMRLLLENKANVHVRNEDGEQPLHLAWQHGKSPLVALLLKFNADPNVADANGEYPLRIPEDVREEALRQMALKAPQAAFVSCKVVSSVLSAKPRLNLQQEEAVPLPSIENGATGGGRLGDSDSDSDDGAGPDKCPVQ